MAHIRRHQRSPFWYLRTRDFESGNWTEKSTGLRADSPEETRAAKRLAEKASAEEQSLYPSTGSAFAQWVPSYLASHWSNRSGDSPRRYALAWGAIKIFLGEKKIMYPRQVRYRHGREYLEWRGRINVYGRKAGHNSALLELKFLSQLLNEAIRLGHTETNPLAMLGIGRVAQKVKPELTDEQIALLREKLRDQPEWMRVCFEIGLYTGCRFNECSFPIADVDFQNKTIRLKDSKRSELDARKYFTVPANEKLLVLLRSLADREFTCRLSRDKNGRINSFFRACGVNASFHSLRVTFITRCHRGELSEGQAMRLVNHSSQLVHRVYSRLNVEDVRAAATKIPLP